jgi:hypothetical protein
MAIILEEIEKAIRKRSLEGYLPESASLDNLGCYCARIEKTWQAYKVLESRFGMIDIYQGTADEATYIIIPFNENEGLII